MVEVNDLSLVEIISLLINKVSNDLFPTTMLESFFAESASYHLIIEIVLILILVKIWLTPRQRTKSDGDNLTEAELDMMVREYTPIPLVNPNEADSYADATVVPVFKGPVVPDAIVDGDKQIISAGTYDFLGFVNDKDVENRCVDVIKRYGVGACGPRGFYGTIDVHVFLENEIAAFLKTEQAIIYSYGFATIASAIPPYSKRSDIIFCDEGVSFATQSGLLASRSHLIWFKHNDMVDLERLMREQEEIDLKKPEKAKHMRRLIVVEGLYTNHGDICPLPKVVELKKKYKARIFLEESNSFGVLGKTGRGITEHFGVDIKEIDQICASMENSLSAVGGFCAGSAFVIDHQRLQGKGYCFSASLPPTNCEAARVALEKLKENPDRPSKLRANAVFIRSKLNTGPMKLKVSGDNESPIIHLRLSNNNLSIEQQKEILDKIVEECYQNGVLVVRAKYIENIEKHLPQPSIRVTISVRHTEKEMENIATTLITAADKLI